MFLSSTAFILVAYWKFLQRTEQELSKNKKVLMLYTQLLSYTSWATKSSHFQFMRILEIYYHILKTDFT